MRQFLLADAAPGMTRDLTGTDYHYLARVRRLTAGAQLTVMDSAGVRYAARVTAVGPASLRLVVGERADADPAAGAGGAAGTGPAAPAVSLTLTLIQALPRGTLMDRVVRQATELGVRAIVPVVAARSQGPRRDAEALARRWARWQRIARQAAQQSGAAPPEVEHPLPLAAYLEARSPADLELVFEPGTEPLHRLLARWVPAAAAAAGVPGAVEPDAAVQAAVMPAAHVSGAPVRGADLRGADLGGTDVRAAHVRCAVGPEGAFSPAELDLFAAHGFHLVGLDAPVLRVDTAVTAALAATRQLLAGVADRWPHAQTHTGPTDVARAHPGYARHIGHRRAAAAPFAHPGPGPLRLTFVIRLLFIDDDRRAHDTLDLVLPPEFDLISATTLADGAHLASSGEVDLVLLDVNFPEGSGLDVLPQIMALPLPPPVVMLTAHHDVRLVVAAIHAGASDYLLKPYELPSLLATLHAALANGAARRAVAGRARPADGLVGETPGLLQVRELIQLYADSDAPVMVTGESGTGKELVARAIHRLSHRSAAPFIAINCGAIPEPLVESELFGSEEGAFTGAVARAGCFERAEGGTLLLDEVAEMPLTAQVALLRVLENREVTRVGGRQPIPLNVRVVSATNRDPERQVEAGRLRVDLWYRLAVLVIHTPALRDRRDDIPLLAHTLLRDGTPASGRIVAEIGAGISHAAVERLCSHSWPGNVRELRNVLERARLLARRRAGGGVVTIQPPDIVLGGPGPR